MADPSPADGLAQAVRRVRLAAGSLAGPLDVFTVAVAAAQSVPDALNPALEKLMPSPLAGIAGLLGEVAPSRGGVVSDAMRSRGAPAPAPKARAASPAAAPAPEPSGPVGRAGAAMGILGKFVTDELTVLGVTGAPAAPPRPQGPMGEIMQSLAGFTGPAPAPATAPATAAAPAAPPRAPAPGKRINPDELLLEELELLMAGGFIPASARARAGAGADLVARKAGVPKPLLPVVRSAATAIGAGLDLLEELTGTGPTPPAQHPARPATQPSAKSGDGIGGVVSGMQEILGELGVPTGSTPQAATGAKAAPTATTFEDERRKLLDVLAAAEKQSAVAAMPQAGASSADVDDLAWLVNEALVEQARLHGMDLR